MVEFSCYVLGTINNKSQRNDQGKYLGWPVTSYGAVYRYTSLYFIYKYMRVLCMVCDQLIGIFFFLIKTKGCFSLSQYFQTN